jgi:hypothetical protein
MEKAHMEIILEDIKGKFDLVLEGHAVLHKEIQDAKKELNEKIEYNNFLIHGFHDSLNKKIEGVESRLTDKIDAVAADLAAHRADTETHRTAYRVSE